MSKKRRKIKDLSAFIEKHDVKNVIMARQLLLVLVNNLLYNDAYFSTNDFNPSMPSAVMSLLQDFENLFPKEKEI